VSLLGSLGGLLGINKNTIDTISKVTGGPVGAAGAFVGDAIQKIQAGRVTTSNPAGMIAVNRVQSPPLVSQASSLGQTVLRLTGQTPPLLPKVGPGIPQLPDSTKTSGVSLFPGGPMVGTQTQYYSPAGPQGGDTRGFHLNKSGYYTKGGTYVAPRSKWVKNRRRNPLNPRALSRAI
jgi:hypothetical protein